MWVGARRANKEPSWAAFTRGGPRWLTRASLFVRCGHRSIEANAFCGCKLVHCAPLNSSEIPSPQLANASLCWFRCTDNKWLLCRNSRKHVSCLGKVGTFSFYEFTTKLNVQVLSFSIGKFQQRSVGNNEADSSYLDIRLLHAQIQQVSDRQATLIGRFLPCQLRYCVGSQYSNYIYQRISHLLHCLHWI